MLRVFRLLGSRLGRVGRLVLYSAGAAAIGRFSYRDTVSAIQPAQAEHDEEIVIAELYGGDPTRRLFNEDPLAATLSWVGVWTIAWGLVRRRRLPGLAGVLMCLFAYATQEYIAEPTKS